MASEEEISKFGMGLPADHSDADIQAFAVYRLKVYNEQGWKSTRLSNYFAEDFEGFNPEKFSKIQPDQRRTLRDYLRDNGVYVRNGRFVSIATALAEALAEELTWPKNEINSTSNTAGVESGVNGRSKTQKFTGGHLYNLDMKLALFNERCDQAQVANIDRHRVFSAMLEGAALHFYLTSIKGSCNNIHEMISKLRSRQNDYETTRTETSLPRPYQDDMMLRNRLLNACEGVEACRLARQKVAATVQGVIDDLYSSAATHVSQENKHRSTQPEALIVDRRRYDFRNRNN
eukprot:IDg531t1